MLSLTNLEAHGICLVFLDYCAAWDTVKSLEGLEAAHNLLTLDLNNNQLTNLTLQRADEFDRPSPQRQSTHQLHPAGEPDEFDQALARRQSAQQVLPAGEPDEVDHAPPRLQSTHQLHTAGGATTVVLDGNPLTTFVLPEPLAVTSLARTVDSLKRRGVSVYSYPLALTLVSPQRTLAGAFEFTLTGPPAAYTILGSVDLAAWSELGTLTNALGTAVFMDAEAKNSSQKFYRGMAKLP